MVTRCGGCCCCRCCRHLRVSRGTTATYGRCCRSPPPPPPRSCFAALARHRRRLAWRPWMLLASGLASVAAANPAADAAFTLALSAAGGAPSGALPPSMGASPPAATAVATAPSGSCLATGDSALHGRTGGHSGVNSVAAEAVGTMAAAVPEEDVAVFVGHQLAVDRPGDSDHNAILFTFGGSGEAGSPPPLKLLSWNILCKYGFNMLHGYPYDGFNRRAEADHDYMARLHRTALAIAQYVRAEAEMSRSGVPQAVLLQECAEQGEVGHGYIPALLTELLRPLGFGVLLHYGEFVTALRAQAAEKVAGLPQLRRQEGRMHIVYCAELGTVFLNVHLRWDRKRAAGEELSRQDLERVLAHLRHRYPAAQIVVAGDTNRVPAELPEEDLGATIEQLTDGLGRLSRPPGPTNVRWNGEQHRSEMTFADFALLAHPGTANAVAAVRPR